MQKLNLIQEENYVSDLQKRLMPLEKYRFDGTVESFDGLKLNYEYYYSADNRKNIVIVHGYTEFLKKYEEMMVYFFEMGFNVFIYDQRGHGFSGRLVEDLELTHVDNFIDYAKDLEAFVDKVILPKIGDAPLYLVSHSMGGAVSAFYLSRNPKVEKAVLSSPMIAPVAHNIPKLILKISAYVGSLKNGWAGQYKHTEGFDPNPDFDTSSDLSYVRFKYNLDQRIAVDEYKNSASSNRWLYESVSIAPKILKGAENIKLPVLLITAENDTVVKNGYQFRLAKKIKNCRHIVIPEAKHSLFTSKDPILRQYYSEVLGFFGEEITF